MDDQESKEKAVIDTKGEIVSEELEPPKTGKGILTLYRLQISLALLIGGFLLFSLQILTASEVAVPHRIFAMLQVQDRAEYNKVVAEREQAAAQPKETGESAKAAPLPDTEGQYKGKPAEGFQERFDHFAAGIKAPHGTIFLPVQIGLVKDRNIVRAGSVPAEKEQKAFGEPVFTSIKMAAKDAAVFLRMVVPNGEMDGRSFIGPFQHDSQEGDQELIAEDGSRIHLEQLPEEASALQGIIISTAEDISPNGMLLLPMGDTSVGDFAKAANDFNRTLLESTFSKDPKAPKPDIVPFIGFSDLRQTAPMYAAAIAGELFFMIGGFLMLFHFLFKVAANDRHEKSLLLNNLIDTCRLLVRERRLYAIVIGLFLGFWLWGMVSSFIDPGGQRRMVQWLASQFAGTSWPLGFAGQAYASGNVIEAAIATFLVNFIQGTVLTLSLISLVPIATAFIVNSLRGQFIGLALAPTKLFFGQAMAPHLITIVLELQGYMIAGFVSVLLPLALLKPQRFGLETRWQAFKKFAVWQFRVLPLIAIILAVAAVYEAVELIMMAAL